MRSQQSTCPRCSGMMIETYSELLSPSDKGEDMFVWRCVNCGDYVDRLVIHNRWALRSQPVSIYQGRAAA